MSGMPSLQAVGHELVAMQSVDWKSAHEALKTRDLQSICVFIEQLLEVVSIVFPEAKRAEYAVEVLAFLALHSKPGRPEDPAMRAAEEKTRSGK